MRLNSKLYKALNTNDAQIIKAAYLEYVKILEAKRAKKDKENEVFNEQIKKKWREKHQLHYAQSSKTLRNLANVNLRFDEVRTRPIEKI